MAPQLFRTGDRFSKDTRPTLESSDQISKERCGTRSVPTRLVAVHGNVSSVVRRVRSPKLLYRDRRALWRYLSARQSRAIDFVTAGCRDAETRSSFANDFLGIYNKES